MEPWKLPLLTLAGLVAGVINTLAGGGSLLALPVLLFAGLDPHAANATNRVGVILQSSAATWQFRRERQLDPKLARRLLPWMLAGAAGGAWLSGELDVHTLKKVFGAVLLAMLALMFLKPERWLKEDTRARPHPLLTGLTFLGIGLYGGFVQAGVGLLLLLGLSWAGGKDLARSNATKALLVAALTLPALLIFAAQGHIDWPAALALSLGSTLGGLLGARLSVRWGPGAIRWITAATVLASVGDLWGLY
jgi:uncharacterized membrane protein YfcA